MALVHGDMVIPAGVFVQAAGVANPNAGSLIPPEGLLMGTYSGTTDTEVIWNNGIVMPVVTPNLLRKVTKSDVPSVLGASVSWNNKGASFRGVVVAQFKTELDDIGGDGTQVEVVLVQAQGFQYIQQPSALNIQG